VSDRVQDFRPVNDLVLLVVPGLESGKQLFKLLICRQWQQISGVEGQLYFVKRQIAFNTLGISVSLTGIHETDARWLLRSP